MDFGEELLPVFMLKDDPIDYTNNWTDYLYVINGSGRMIQALTEELHLSAEQAMAALKVPEAKRSRFSAMI